MLNTPKPSAKPFAFNAVSQLFILISLLFMASSCKKQAVDQLSLLPPATQTGANTFGCLVNGTAFVPNKRSLINGPFLRSEYGFTENGYVFYVNASVDLGSGNVNSVYTRTDSLKISEGKIFPLTKSFTPGMACGGYSNNLSDYNTNANATGQLTITHLDTVNQIASGTFFFNAAGKTGDTVKITNGRFDVHYTY